MSIYPSIYLPFLYLFFFFSAFLWPTGFSDSASIDPMTPHWRIQQRLTIRPSLKVLQKHPI
jgi:hypothetical protein